MILSQTAIYALRSLAVLTSLKPGERLTAEALSGHTNVPRDYLAKVMRQLSEAGIVAAVRGHGGGFFLCKSAKQVPLADVMTAVDMQLGLGQCAFATGKCNRRRPCSLHGVWSKLQQEVGDWVNGCTLADIDPVAL